jgi:levansucrase
MFAFYRGFASGGLIAAMLNVQDSFVGSSNVPVSRWTAEVLALLHTQEWPAAPLITAGDAVKFIPTHDLWDIWPLQNIDGSVTDFEGASIWMVLSAPCLPDPNMRHDCARTRMLFRKDGDWHDCGNLFPDSLNPGSREWSGSARLDASNNTITAFFTAAGRADEDAHSFEQRLFQTTGELTFAAGLPEIRNWTEPMLSVDNDGLYYVDLAVERGVPGRIRGFRDPYWFCDPADGQGYLLFTGSLANACSDYSGVVGIAAANNEDGSAGFTLLPPIINADGVVNELERPHMFVRDGKYYLFWSSQSAVFAPADTNAPTGLYGMVGDSVTGPFLPLNGSGLVIANPKEEPIQAYCWQVLDTLDVVSFVDHWGMQGRDPASDPTLNRSQFGGNIAPMLKITLDGDQARLVGAV